MQKFVCPLITDRLSSYVVLASHNFGKMSAPHETAIRSKLTTQLGTTYLEVINESYMHNVPKALDAHFKAVIASDKFTDLPLNKQGTVTILWYRSSGVDPVPITLQNASEGMNLSDPTKIIIHGWEDNGAVFWIRQMAANFHKKESCNVLAVDWSQTASLKYLQAATSVRAVGNVVGDFISALKAQFDSILSKIHVIGHSLGAQVGAFAAKRVIANNGDKISRLSGLDAAGPFFEPAPPENRIDKTDAKFVDLLHTDVIRGMKFPYGCKDFYFNLGIFQLTCSNKSNPVDATSCSHQWAHTYYNITILDPQKYLACSDPVTAALGSCAGQTAFAGYGATAEPCGSYYIFTDRNGDPIKPR